MPEPTFTRRQITSDRIKIGYPAERIVDMFGGMANFCDATGFGRSAVHGWMRNGLIPAKWQYNAETGREESYQRVIMRCGKARGLPISPKYFIEDPEHIANRESGG